MSVIGIYKEPQDIVFKMLREGRRAWISKDEQDKYDGFCNFCITAHSLRDWCIKYLGLSGAQESAFHTEMNSYKYFPESRDIANSSKHFGLDSKPSTVLSALATQSDFAIINGSKEQSDYELFKKKDIAIILAGNTNTTLFMFLHHVATNWINVLNLKGIPLNPGFHPIYMFIEQG